MRCGTVLGLLGAVGLAGLSSAQSYGNLLGTSENGGNPGGVSVSAPGTVLGPNSGSGSGTCPAQITTVFITVTPTSRPTVISTVIYTVTAGESPDTGPASLSPVVASTTSLTIWSTDFLTLTLPPSPGQATSDVVTYTIVSPEASNPTSASSGSHLSTVTVTQPRNGGPGSDSSAGRSRTSSSLIVVTKTIPAGGSASDELTGVPYNIPTTSSQPESSFSPLGGITLSSQYTETTTVALPTITITLPGELPTEPTGGMGGSLPLQTFTVTIPSGEAGSEPQTLTVTAPSETPTSVNGGANGAQSIQTFTVTLPAGEAGGQPQTLTITATNESPTSPISSAGSQPLQTFTVTVPASEAGSKPQTLTITAPNMPLTSSNGGQPIQTFTVTLPAGEAGSQPQTLTITAPNGSPTSLTGATKSQPLQTFTVTVPAGEAGSTPQTLTITEPNGLPTSATGEASSSLPIQTFTVTLPSGEAGDEPQTLTVTVPNGLPNGPNGVSESQPVQTLTVTALDGLSTFTVTVSEPSPFSYGVGSPQGTVTQGPGGSQVPSTISITAPAESATVISGMPSDSEPFATITLTIPGSATGPDARQPPLQTITLTIPLESSVGPIGGPGSSSQSPLPTFTVTVPAFPSDAGGQAGPQTFTLTAGVSPNISPVLGSPGTSTCDESKSGPQTIESPSPFQTSGIPLVSETTLFPPEESGYSAAIPMTTGSEGAGGSGIAPVTGPSRAPFSSVPNSGWNFSTTLPAVGPESSETTCTDSTTQPDLSVSTFSTPTFPPPVSPAPTSLGEGPIATLPSESSGDNSGSVTALSCLSMTTMVISTLTFSWCEQASTVAPAEVSPTGPLSIQNLGTSTGQYEFGSKSMSPRSPAMLDFPHGSIARIPSTLTTVTRPSISNEDAPIASATPDCRYQDQLGNKTLNFDDFPLGPPRPLSEYSPVHHFYFAGGFAVVPPVLDTFKPSSGDLMLQFTPSSISNTTEDGISPDTAKIDVGAQMFTTCFSFNFTGVNLGCDSKLLPCSFSLTGFKYDPSAGLLERASQTFTIPAYPSNGNSALTPVTIFNFTDLTTITLKAEADGKPTIWYADDFTFGWFDNTCDAGLCRSRLPDGIQRRD